MVNFIVDDRQEASVILAEKDVNGSFQLLDFVDLHSRKLSIGNGEIPSW